MKQGDTYVIFVEVYTKSILTLWRMSGIPVMHSDTQNAAQQFNTLCSPHVTFGLLHIIWGI